MAEGARNGLYRERRRTKQRVEERVKPCGRAIEMRPKHDVDKKSTQTDTQTEGMDQAKNSL